MTYLPTNCFALIKSFAGFDARFRQKKIAGMIKNLNPHTSDRIPITFKVRYIIEKSRLLKQICDDIREEANNDRWYSNMQHHYYNGTLASIGLDYEDYKHWRDNNDYVQSLDAACLLCRYAQDAKQRARYSANKVVAAMNKPAPLIRLLTYTRPGFIVRKGDVTLKELKQYCRENNMRGFSKHKKQALQTFILKYEF